MSAHLATAEPGLPPFYRRRRFWLGAAPVLGMVAAFLIGLALLSWLNSTNGLGTGPQIPAPKVTPTPKTVKFNPETTKDVHALITLFVKTAVARKHLDKSYGLIGPSLREGIPRKKWDTGYTTVVPYPVNADTYVTYDKHVSGDYQYANSARQEVHVVTPHDAKETMLETTATFFVFLIKRHGHWLVDNWVPRWTAPIPTGNG
jgi:hypothetical protein